MSADDDTRNGELDEMLAGEEETALGTAQGERDIEADEPGGLEPPPEPPTPEFLADAGTADIGMPDEDAADELVGDDMDAAEWAALDSVALQEPVALPAPVAFDAALPDADDGIDLAELEEVEARLARLEAVQHQVVHRGPRPRGRAGEAQGRRVDHRRRRGRLHPAAAAARRRAQASRPRSPRQSRPRSRPWARSSPATSRPIARPCSRARPGRSTPRRSIGADRAAAGAAALPRRTARRRPAAQPRPSGHA